MIYLVSCLLVVRSRTAVVQRATTHIHRKRIVWIRVCVCVCVCVCHSFLRLSRRISTSLVRSRSSATFARGAVDAMAMHHAWRFALGDDLFRFGVVGFLILFDFVLQFVCWSCSMRRTRVKTRSRRRRHRRPPPVRVRFRALVCCPFSSLRSIAIRAAATSAHLPSIDDFKFLKVISRGGYGTVYLGAGHDRVFMNFY
jgi:hypothetical protein